MSGDEALILCRARHAYDEIGAGDFYRAANQRMVMGAVAKKLLESDPATIATTVASLCDYIDTDMSVTDIVNTAVAMKGMDTSTDIYSTMNPTISSYENGVWCEYSNNEAWSAMMKRVDAGEPPTVDASDSANNGGVTDGSIDPEVIAQNVLSGDESSNGVTGSIVVRNGSGVSGVAADASSVLSNRGYDISSVGDADSYDYTNTIVVYDDTANASSARAIARKPRCRVGCSERRHVPVRRGLSRHHRLGLLKGGVGRSIGCLPDVRRRLWRSSLGFCKLSVMLALSFQKRPVAIIVIGRFLERKEEEMTDQKYHHPFGVAEAKRTLGRTGFRAGR